MAKDLGVDWEHIDLFFYRERSQKDCKDLFWKHDQLTPFGREQIELSKRLIAEVDPQVIVVANAFASDVAIKVLPCDEYDEQHGYHGNAVHRQANTNLIGINVEWTARVGSLFASALAVAYQEQPPGKLVAMNLHSWHCASSSLWQRQPSIILEGSYVSH